MEVLDIIVEGNTNMSDEEISQEVFAFMREKGARDEVLQRVNTRTVDSLGTSDPRPGSMVKPRGSITPTTELSRIYVPHLYREVTEHLVGLYWERGFLEAFVVDTCDIRKQQKRRWGKTPFTPLEIDRGDGAEEDTGPVSPCLFIDEDLERLLVVITVSEGPQTTLASVHVNGNSPDVFTEAELLSAAHVKRGNPYNEFRLREAAAKIRAIYQARGYMFASVDWTSSSSEDGSLADVLFEVKEGPQVRVDHIMVNTDHTSAVLIRDRLTLRKGDLITPEALAASEQRLMELWIFDNATVQMAMPEWPQERKNLIVRVSPSESESSWPGAFCSYDGLSPFTDSTDKPTR